MSDPLLETFGTLFAGLIIIVIISVGTLLASSKAALYWEQKIQGYGYNCWYFTGTRTIESGSLSDTGCKRFINVGGE